MKIWYGGRGGEVPKQISKQKGSGILQTSINDLSQRLISQLKGNFLDDLDRNIFWIICFLMRGFELLFELLTYILLKEAEELSAGKYRGHAATVSGGQQFN